MIPNYMSTIRCSRSLSIVVTFLSWIGCVVLLYRSSITAPQQILRKWLQVESFVGGYPLKPLLATPPVWCTESIADVACHTHLKPLVGLVIHALVHVRNHDELIYITRYNNILHQTIISPRIGHNTWSTGVTLQKYAATRQSRTIIRTLRHAMYMYLQPILLSCYCLSMLGQ